MASYLAGHPKFYYVDPGLYRSLRPAGPLDAPGEIGSAALEVKAGRDVRPADLRGLRTFREDYPQARTLSLGPGPAGLPDRRLTAMIAHVNGVPFLLPV